MPRVSKYSVIAFAVFYWSVRAEAQTEVQVEFDTQPTDSIVSNSLYVDYSDQWLLKLMTVSKSNALDLINRNNNTSLRLRSLDVVSIGFGFNYKWFGLSFGIGIPANAADEKKYGKSERVDLQVNIYSKKFVVDAFIQEYKGFYVANADKLTEWDDSIEPQRPRMSAFSLGLGAYYVFNHKNFSYRAAYIRNVMQKKSAGSFLLGGFYNLNSAGFPPGDKASFVPNYFPIEIQESIPIEEYFSRNVGISFGYTYTFVFFKRFFLNLSLLPGVGAKSIVVYRDGMRDRENSLGVLFNARTALGYENKYFLLGLTTYAITGSMHFEEYEIKPSTSNLKIFVAKRLDFRREKK